MHPTAVTQLSAGQTSSLLGLDKHAMATMFYQRTPTDFGVRLWCIDPPHDETVRAADRGTDLDALKVIDFYAPNFDESVKTLTNAGYTPKDDIARYTLPEGEFREAHFWRPDNIVCAIISGPADFFSDFVTARDHQFSEPQSISAPVSDVAAVLDFYESIFGFVPLHRYEFTNASFDAMVGADEPLSLSATNIGTDLRAPYLGIIDYGPSINGAVSLAGRSRPPMRGLVGVELLVDDLQAIIAAADRAGTVVFARSDRVSYPPYGEIRSCLIEGPHGVVHHVIQPIAN